MRFNSLFAGLNAEQFVNEILVNRFNVKYLVVGDDFRFGKNRQGDYSLLKKSGEKTGFCRRRLPLPLRLTENELAALPSEMHWAMAI